VAQPSDKPEAADPSRFNGGLIFLLFVISQFLAYFTYSNMATVVAVKMGDALEHAKLGTIPLMLGLITITGLVGLLILGVIPKWALLAPIFVPLFMKLVGPSRGCVGGLSGRRLAAKRRHPADALFRADCHSRAAL
jgi:hypothetical protein